MFASDKKWRVKKDRKRATTQRKSCDTCHKSKTRCDRRRPVCSTCEIFGRACTYMQRDQEGVPESHGKPPSDNVQSTQSEQQHGPKPHQQQLQQQFPPEHHVHQQALASDYEFIPIESHSLPQCSASSTNSSSPDDVFLERTIDGLWNYSLDSGDPYGKVQVADEHMPPCTRCFDFSCDHCIQAVNTVCLDQEYAHSRRHTQPSHTTVAEFLMDAMASQSDNESSAILAALRTGISSSAIYAALVSPDCSAIGIAHVLGKQQKSPSQQYDTGLSNTNSLTWRQLRYESTAAQQDGTPTELIGTMKHSRRPATKDEPLARLQTTPPSYPDIEKDICLPTWAILPPRTLTGATDPFDEALATVQAEIAAGADIAAYCGPHAYLGALLHPKHANTAPRLSHIIASVLKRLLPDDAADSVTGLALMWLHWCIWSWLLSPTEETYNRMPKIIRPTPWQICRPHTLVYDFVIIPALRDHLCNNPMVSNAWLAEAGNSMLCYWPKTVLHSLCRNPVTKAIDLHPDCKAYAGRSQNWSFGPAIRAQFPDIDRFATIRSKASPT